MVLVPASANREGNLQSESAKGPLVRAWAAEPEAANPQR